jgi:hypothetical protein
MAKSRAEKLIENFQAQLVDSGYYTPEKALVEIAKRAMGRLSVKSANRLPVDIKFEIVQKEYYNARKPKAKTK